jgi:hypothetical protein
MPHSWFPTLHFLLRSSLPPLSLQYAPPLALLLLAVVTVVPTPGTDNAGVQSAPEPSSVPMKPPGL